MRQQVERLIKRFQPEAYRRAHWKRHGCENVRVLTEGITVLLGILPAIYYARLSGLLPPNVLFPIVLALETFLCMAMLLIKARLRDSRVCTRQAYALFTAVRAGLL